MPCRPHDTGRRMVKKITWLFLWLVLVTEPACAAQRVLPMGVSITLLSHDQMGFVGACTGKECLKPAYLLSLQTDRNVFIDRENPVPYGDGRVTIMVMY